MDGVPAFEILVLILLGIIALLTLALAWARAPEMEAVIKSAVDLRPIERELKELNEQLRAIRIEVSSDLRS